MATGHILPGYGDPVSRLRRVRHVGFPIESEKLLKMRQASSLDKNDFEMIRAQARSIWSQPDRERTTYNFYHSGDRIGNLVEKRPTSPTRRNNPHPPLVFLTNRLHHIAGYQQPDRSLHTQAYQVDGSEDLSMVENQARRLTRSKYLDRPATAAINQYKDPYNLKEFLDPTPAQATEAWLNYADKQEKEDAIQALENQRQNYLESQKYQYDITPRAKTAIPSTYRWMKTAGPHETSRLHGINTPELPPTPRLPYQMEIMGLRHSRNERPKGRPQLRFNSARGDYSIHPDWPPSIPHHFVP